MEWSIGNGIAKLKDLLIHTQEAGKTRVSKIGSTNGRGTSDHYSDVVSGLKELNHQLWFRIQ